MTTTTLDDIGRAAYESIAEMVAALDDDWEQAEQRIQEDALSIEFRSGWSTDRRELQAEEFNILLTTGGPAVRITGELDEHGEPRRAWLEVADWGQPWTRYFDASQDVLLAYCACFYMGV
jgi:hypothetical protein